MSGLKEQVAHRDQGQGVGAVQGKGLLQVGSSLLVVFFVQVEDTELGMGFEVGGVKLEDLLEVLDGGVFVLGELLEGLGEAEVGVQG